jgi:hypothetical protein
MNCNTPADGQTSEECEAKSETKDRNKPTKWGSTVDALNATFQKLLTKQSNANVGLTFFSVDDKCGVRSTPYVPVKPLTENQVTDFRNQLNLRTLDPAGQTPLVGATVLAYKYLYENPGNSGTRSNRSVVLITDGVVTADGEESCPPAVKGALCGKNSESAMPCTDYLLEKAATAKSVNIRTFVVGSPGSEMGRAFLSKLAIQGGTRRSATCEPGQQDDRGDCHYDLSKEGDLKFADELSNALSAVTGEALGCELAAPDGSKDAPGSVNVQYRLKPGDEPICLGKLDDAAESGNGWRFASSAESENGIDYTKVVLLGAECKRVKENPSIQVDVILGCKTIPIL